MGVFEYSAYGIKILSSQELPLKPSTPCRAEEQVLLVPASDLERKQPRCPYSAPIIEMHGRRVALASNLPLNLSRTSADRLWRLEVAGLFTFRWHNSEDRISISLFQADNGKLCFWLLHTVIPVYLMLKEKSFFLHASAIESENGALVFVAPSSGGKSSLVNAFVRQGSRLVADDKLRIRYSRNRYFAFPSHPYRRPVRENENLGEYSPLHAVDPLPIKAIYLLNLTDRRELFKIDEIHALDKFEVLKKACLYEPASITKHELEHIIDLARRCRLYRIDLPAGLELLPSRVEAILDQAKSIGWL